MSDLLWPKTLGGWRKLFWLALRCCPFHRRPLTRDGWFGDPGTTGYCFRCDGIAMFPLGLLQALRWNARAASRSSAGKGDEESP